MRRSIYQILQPKKNRLLDAIGALPSAAYSLRLLTKTYKGFAIRVRRSSDNTESDIGFTKSGLLDLAQLLAFCGSGDGFVTLWYNQTGLTNMVQSIPSTQPTLVRAGVLNTKNGLPAIQQSIDQRLQVQSISAITQDLWTVSYTAYLEGTVNRRILNTYQGAANWLLGWWNNTERSVYQNGTGLYNPPIPATTATQTYTAIGRAGSSLSLLYRNGVDFTGAGNATSSRPTETLVTNGIGDAESSNCGIQELLLYNRGITDAERVKIETNVKKYHQII
jgi:Alpha-L-arabinofuranosidase B, catalytic